MTRKLAFFGLVLFASYLANAEEIHFELINLNTTAPTAELWDAGTSAWVGLTNTSTALSGGEANYRRHRYANASVTDADLFFVRIGGSDEAIFSTADLSAADYSGTTQTDFYVDYRFGGSVTTLWYDGGEQFHFAETNEGLTPVASDQVYGVGGEPATGQALSVASAFASFFDPGASMVNIVTGLAAMLVIIIAGLAGVAAVYSLWKHSAGRIGTGLLVALACPPLASGEWGAADSVVLQNIETATEAANTNHGTLLNTIATAATASRTDLAFIRSDASTSRSYLLNIRDDAIVMKGRWGGLSATTPYMLLETIANTANTDSLILDAIFQSISQIDVSTASTVVELEAANATLIGIEAAANDTAAATEAVELELIDQTFVLDNLLLEANLTNTHLANIDANLDAVVTAVESIDGRLLSGGNSAAQWLEIIATNGIGEPADDPITPPIQGVTPPTWTLPTIPDDEGIGIDTIVLTDPLTGAIHSDYVRTSAPDWSLSIPIPKFAVGSLGAFMGTTQNNGTLTIDSSNAALVAYLASTLKVAVDAAVIAGITLVAAFMLFDEMNPHGSGT